MIKSINSEGVEEIEEKGSSTELAVIKYFEKMNVGFQTYRDMYEVKHKFPFSSSRKRMSVVVNYKDNASLFTKGASEIVLSTCTQWYNSQNGEIEPISSAINDKIKDVINSMA